MAKEVERPEMTDREVAVRAKINDLVERVPDSGSDGLGILERILDADLDDLTGEDTGTTPIESLYGHVLRIDTMSKIESEYADAPGTMIPYYLVLRGVDLDTQEPFVSTLSGASVFLTLARYFPGHFPVSVKLSEKRTNNGYDVQNVAVLSYRQVEEAVSK